MHVHIHEAESMYRTETTSLPLLVGAGWVDSTPPNRAVWSAHPYFQLDSTTSTYNSTRPPDVRLPAQTLKPAESSDTRRPSTAQLPVNSISCQGYNTESTIYLSGTIQTRQLDVGNASRRSLRHPAPLHGFRTEPKLRKTGAVWAPASAERLLGLSALSCTTGKDADSLVMARLPQ